MIDHAVPSRSFQRPIIVEIAAAEKPTTLMAKGECQINGPCPDRADSPTPTAHLPPNSKKPRQSLTGLCMLNIDRHYILGGINDCLRSKLAPWILALSTDSRRVRTVERSDYRIDINFVISPALISSTGRLARG
jgi:hypothetical protein